MPKLTNNQRKILNDAYKTMKDGSGVLKDNDKIKAFAAERAEIDKAAAKKTPFIKEFINLHKESESKTYTNIGRMVKDMKIVAAEQEALKKAAKMCKDEADKAVFLQLAEELNTHPAMQDYEKYIKGLRFISGLDEEIEKEVQEFFDRDLRIPLWVNDPDFDRWRLTEQEAPETDYDVANQEYQKLVSKAKAREVFTHRSIESHMSVFEQFGGVKNPGNAVGVFGERMAPAGFCVGKLLQKGYSLDEVLNPKQLLEEKKAIGEEYMKQRNSGTLESQKWYMDEMYRNAEAMIKAYHRYIKEHKDELKTEQDLALHASYLGMFSILCFDMTQELTKHCKTVHTEFKTEKEFSDMGYRLGTYYYGAGTGTADKILYELESTHEPAEFIVEIQRQLAIKGFLEEIQKDEPDMDRIGLSGFAEMREVQEQLSVLEIFEDCTEWDVPEDKNRKKVIDPEHLTKKHIKVLASTMSQKFVQDNQMSVNGIKVKTTVKEDPEYCNGHTIKKGMELGRIVTAGDKQLVKTDIPYKYFNDLEKKGIRGKAKDNSAEFNKLLAQYGETMLKLNATGSSIGDCLKDLDELKFAAGMYIKAKREQKGYNSKTVPDAAIDAQMLGKEKGGASIFTSRGRDRYQFALDLIERAAALETKFYEELSKDVVTDKDVIQMAIDATTNKETNVPQYDLAPAPTPAQKSDKIDVENLTLKEKEIIYKEAMRRKKVEWASNKIDRTVNACGDPDKIQNFIDTHPNLTDIEKEHLEERKEANTKIRELENSRYLEQKNRKPCIVNGDKIMLDKEKTVPRQTSLSGCWSCVLSDMLAHFGVDLTQKEIRYYRPEIHPEYKDGPSAKELMDNLGKDEPNEIYEVADLIHRTVPNVVLHHRRVMVNHDDKQKIADKIKDVLVKKNSPVTVLINGHYRSIVGMDGDKFVLEDPLYENQHFYYSIDKLFGEAAKTSEKAMILDWLEDLKFTKNGECKNLTERNKQDGIDCKDGVFTTTTDYTHHSHVKGIEIMCEGDDYGEMIYFPKMAFEKEMNMSFEDVMDDELETDNVQEIPQEEFNQEQKNEEPKLSKREILKDAKALAKDEKMFKFADAMWSLYHHLDDAGATYNDWEDTRKAQFPLDELIKDLEIDSTEEELRNMSTRDFYDMFAQIYDDGEYLSACDLRKDNPELTNDSDDLYF